MIYVMSDLHGCYDKYIAMLEKIKLKDTDTLYILGDIVDRGEHGIKILLDINKRNNVIPLIGNHDFLAMHILKMLTKKASKEFLEVFNMWLSDGGKPTYKEYLTLNERERAELDEIFDSFLIFEELSVNGKRFFLSHTVPSKERMLDFNSVDYLELIMSRAEYDKVYFDDKIIVTGHTPTALIDSAYENKIYEKNNHIAIDCGAAFGGSLGCICLDTLEKFYV